MSESQALINIIQKSFDTDAQAFVITDVVNKQVEDGNYYTRVNVATKGSTQFLNVHLKKGLATYAVRHMIPEISSPGAGTIYLYEMAKTSGAGGSTITLLNSNRNSTKASLYRLVVGKSTFSSSTGTLLASRAIVAGAAPVKLNGAEWILKSTKEYLLRMDPSAASTGINITVSWYEEA